MIKNLLERFKNKFSKLFRQEEGAIAILAGLLFVVVMGFAALAIDASLWYSQQRQLQFAADAGAIGGAIALKTTGVTTITTYATNDIQLNQCTSSNNCTISSINNPPTSGSSAGNTGAVEVILTKPADIFLSGLFLGTTPILKARAVAGNQPTNNCIISLAGSGVGINVKGGGSIISPTCGAYANSVSNNAVNVVGGGSITTSTVAAVGGTSGGGTITATGGITTGAPAITDPYASVVMPTPSACAATDYVLNNTTGTISPGTYCGGITLKSSAILTMNPGVYILVQSGNGPSQAGNFIATSQSSITGNGVTIVMTTTGGSTNFGTVQFPSQVTTNMSAPTTGATAGILFFGDRNSSGLNEKFTGGTTQTLSGVTYFPTNDIDYSGQAGISGVPCFEIVSNTVTFTGGSTLGNGCPTTALTGTTQLLE